MTEPMKTRTVHICIADASGKLIVDRPESTRNTHCAVHDVPADIATSKVLLQIERVVIWPWPKTLQWSDVAGLAQGAILAKTRSWPF